VVLTQGLMLARQVLHPLSHTPSLFVLVIFHVFVLVIFHDLFAHGFRDVSLL
jgi:hypothetical protein